MLEPWLQKIWDGLFAVDQVDDKEVFGAKGRRPLAADLFQEAQKLGVLDLAVERYPDRGLARAGEVGERLAVPDALPVDEVEALSSSFDESTLGQDLGNPSVARVLLPEEVAFVALPELAEQFDGRGIKIFETSPWTDFSREIRSGFIKDPSE